MNSQSFELISGVDAEPLFESEEAYLAFRTEFEEQIKPELDRLSEARRQSEEEAKQHMVC